MSLPGRTTSACDDDTLCHTTAAAYVFNGVVSSLQNLIQKLKPGGRMVIPVGEQNAMQVYFLPLHRHSLQFFLGLQQFV